MKMVKEMKLLSIFCCIFFVKFSSANPSLEGYECTGGHKWKIAKFEQIFCYMKVRSPGKHETVISNNHCGQLDRAAHVASIHSMAENNFLEAVFTNGFIGLFQPGYGPYNPGLYRWEDGTPLNFIHWDRGFHLKPQPNNDRPIERLTRLRKNKKFHGWHDWFAGGLDYVICKKPATKIPAPAAPPVPAIPPTSAAPKLPIKPQSKVTPAPLKFSDAENGKVPTIKSEQSKVVETPAPIKYTDNENGKVPAVKPEQLVDPPKKSSQDNVSKNIKIIENTYIIDTDPKHSQTTYYTITIAIH